MKKLLIAVLLVAVMAVPAFASVQNVKVSGDLKVTSVLRDNFDLGLGANQNDVLSYTRVRIDADLTDNVSTTVRLLNERTWGKNWSGTDNNQEIDLDLAYVQLREMLYSPLTVTLGRQEFFYGNGFIIGGNGPNNLTSGPLAHLGAQDLSMRRSIDGVKLVFNYDPLTVDVIAGVVDSNTIGFQSHDKTDDVNIYGINANYKLSDKWNTVAEAYFFAKLDRTNNISANLQKDDKVYVPGMRLSTNPIKGLNLQGEIALQGGTAQLPTVAAATTSTKRAALGGQFIASYLLPFEKTAKYEPVVAYAYTYVSGDKDLNGAGTTSDRMKAWDPMFERVASGKIYNAIFDLTNVHASEFSFSMKPVQDLTAKLTWTMLSLDKKINAATWSPTGMPSPASYTVKGDKKALGNEVDVDLTYAYTEDVSFGVSAGWFVPGSVFADQNDQGATQLLTSMSVAF